MANRTLMTKKLSDKETAAVYMHVFGGEKDWRKLYFIASDWTDEEIEANPDKFKYYVSKWKNSEKIDAEVKRVLFLKEAMLQRAKAEAFEDGKKAAMGDSTTQTESGMILNEASKALSGSKVTDYTDPERQKEKLNQIINNAKDNGEALDALKVIIQGQKNDQEAAKSNQVQRFYVPLRCYECPLYKEKKK